MKILKKKSQKITNTFMYWLCMKQTYIHMLYYYARYWLIIQLVKSCCCIQSALKIIDLENTSNMQTYTSNILQTWKNTNVNSRNTIQAVQHFAMPLICRHPLLVPSILDMHRKLPASWLLWCTNTQHIHTNNKIILMEEMFGR